MESRMAFFKCFFCCKNFNKLQLIEMDENVVQINEDEISYKDLIFDVCLVKIDSNSKTNNICIECNNNLMSFHFFKRDVKKYSNFREHLEKLEILSKVESFVDEFESPLTLNVFQDANKLSIYSHVDCINEEHFEQERKDELELDETYEELIVYDLEETKAADESSDPLVQLNQIVTNEDLEWIKKEVKTSEVNRWSRIVFKCSVCASILPTSELLAQHLRDVHIIVENEAEKILEKVQKDEMLAEVKTSRIKMITKNGSESIWKCTRCSDKRAFKSEKAFKLHLLSIHLRTSDEVTILVDDDKTSVANVEDNKTYWNCPHCEIISCKTKKSLACHIKFSHPMEYTEDPTQYLDAVFEEPPEKTFEVSEIEEFLLSDEEPQPGKKRKLNKLNDLTVDQINWIRKEVAAGETIRGRKKAFKCTVCECVLSTQASLTRHLRDVHILTADKEDKTAFKQEVKSSKFVIETSNGVETIWKCRRCDNDRIYKSEQTLKLHLRMVHIRATIVDTAFIAACKTKTFDADGPREVWKCPDCMRVFRHRDSLRNHIKLEHPDIDENEAKKNLQKEQETLLIEDAGVITRIVEKLENKEIGKSSNFCAECGIKFATARHHMKPKIHRECHEIFKILAPQAPHYKCTSCRIIFNSEAAFNDHILIHDIPENVVPIPAEGLAKFGATCYKVPEGDADDAVDEAVWKCGHCSVRYFDENDCISHIMLLHSSPLYCFLDNREFGGSSGMSKFIQHMKNKHPDLFPDLSYPCGTCKLEFPSIYEKLAHQKVCSSKKFQCDYCDKRFMNKHQLLAHILYQLGLSGFSCEFCGKRCKSLSDLKIHQNVHSMARPYDCSICQKTFKTPGARSSHMEGHNDGINCEICGAKLSNRTLYQRHKRFQHNQEFRISQLEKNGCNLCGKSFLRTSHYKQHMKQQHGVQQA